MLSLDTLFAWSNSIQWAVTLSLEDGCFQAHLLEVGIQIKICLATSQKKLETLVGDLGYFPLEYGPLHPYSDC